MNPNQMSQVMATSVQTSSTQVIASLVSIFLLVVYFFLFEENNEQGWKVIIPIYGTYLKFKLFYKTSRFWLFVVFVILLFLSIAYLVFLGMISLTSMQMTDMMGILGIVSWITFIISIFAVLLISILYDISICRVYGKSGLFVVAMIFFSPICLAYLAWENRDKLNKTNQGNIE